MMVCPSVDLPAYNKWLNSQKVNKALLTSLPHFAFIIRIFFFKPCGMWKFPGPGSNLSNCNNLGCRSDNARSLNPMHCRGTLYILKSLSLGPFTLRTAWESRSSSLPLKLPSVPLHLGLSSSVSSWSAPSWKRSPHRRLPCSPDSPPELLLGYRTPVF